MKNLSWIFIIAILVAGGFFIAGNLSEKTADEPLLVQNNIAKDVITNVDNKDSTLKPEAEAKGPVFVEAMAGKGNTKSEQGKLPFPPTLGRPININSSFSDSDKEMIIEQIKHFEASLINKPANIHEWIQLGNLRKAIGDYLGAIEYWEYASLLEPTYHVPYNNLGNLYQYYLNDVFKAEEYLKKYIELSSKTEEPYKLLFDLYTTSYMEKENLAQGVLEEGVKNATHNDYLKRLLENYKKEKGIE